jgi:hypothetical protein
MKIKPNYGMHLENMYIPQSEENFLFQQENDTFIIIMPPWLCVCVSVVIFTVMTLCNNVVPQETLILLICNSLSSAIATWRIWELRRGPSFYWSVYTPEILYNSGYEKRNIRLLSRSYFCERHKHNMTVSKHVKRDTMLGHKRCTRHTIFSELLV